MRAYHSGDLASWTEDGRICIWGRIDNQVKLRGFRIELDEIERVMGSYPDVKGSAVKLCHGDTDYLAGYITSADIAKKVPKGTADVYVRVDENKLYYVLKNGETGNMDIWE